MNNLIEYVKIRAKLSGRQLLSFDELAEFAAEQGKELEDKGVLFQIKDADGIICTECDEHCWKPVETRLKDGKVIGVIYCEDEDCGGLIPVELERLQQWEIVTEKLPRPPKGNNELLSMGRRGRPIADNKKEITKKICDFIENNPKEIPTIGKWTFLVDKFIFPYTSAKNRRGEALKYYLKKYHQKAYKDLQ